jgi:hypothetical protein
MLTQKPKIPAWIDAEIKTLAIMTETHNVEMLRLRRSNPKGVNVDIYYHSAGTDSYYCDIRKSYFTYKEIMEQADQKTGCGQYLFTAIIKYQAGMHIISSKSMSTGELN